jgi:hypothetical protein
MAKAGRCLGQPESNLLAWSELLQNQGIDTLLDFTSDHTEGMTERGY